MTEFTSYLVGILLLTKEHGSQVKDQSRR